MRHLLAAAATAGTINTSGRNLVAVTAANFLLFPLVAFLAGLVLRDFWNWFAAPVLMRPISLAQAVGFLLLIYVFRVFFTSPQLSGEDPPTAQFKVLAAVAKSIMLLFLWAMGAMIHALSV